MKKVQYSAEPAARENIGLGKMRYRWDIEQVSVAQVESDGEPVTMWECYEVEVDGESLTDAEVLAQVKGQKVAEIAAYDKSSAVNVFSLNGVFGWLDRETRVSLVNTIGIEKSAGLSVTTLWFNGGSITIPCDLALGMLAQLEMYAHECYNVTAQHKAEVAAMTDVESVAAYDVTVGYPAMPEFSTAV